MYISFHKLFYTRLALKECIALVFSTRGKHRGRIKSAFQVEEFIALCNFIFVFDPIESLQSAKLI